MADMAKRVARRWLAQRPAKALICLVFTGAGIHLSVGAVPLSAQTALELNCGLEPGPKRAVAEVLDGDTFRLDDGKDVRLIGLVAPRSEDVGAPRGTWPPEIASRIALQNLLKGQSVSLAFLGPRTDRYGRVMAHVFLERAGGVQWVQAMQLGDGAARVFAAPEHQACLTELLMRELAARNAKRGLWANAAYHVRPADRPSELQRFHGTLQLVAGRLAKAGGTRGLILLDFISTEVERAPVRGRSGATFRVSMKRGAAALADYARLPAGSDVLVRGWIVTRSRGPEIEVLGPSQMSIETAAPALKNERPADEPPGASKP